MERRDRKSNIPLEDRFKQAHKRPGIKLVKVTPDHLGTEDVLTVVTEFIADRRNLPTKIDGVSINYSILQEDLPEEFHTPADDHGRPIGYVWAPERFEAFVDRAQDDIRQKLGDSTMSRTDMLDALSLNGDFNAWKKQCEQWEIEGKIPPYTSS